MVSGIGMVKDETSAGHMWQVQVLGCQVGYPVRGSLKRQKLGVSQCSLGLQCATDTVPFPAACYPGSSLCVAPSYTLA